MGNKIPRIIAKYTQILFRIFSRSSLMASVMLLFSSAHLLGIEGPLSPVQTDTPQETFRTFMEAMNQYKKGVDGKDSKLKEHIGRAVRTLDLSQTPAVLRADFGKETVIYLKEVIDRVIIIDFDLIPPGNGQELSNRWRLKDTEIVVHLVESGERKGEYLFSPETVARAKEFYQRVRDFPYLPGSGLGASYQDPWIESIFPVSLKVTVLGHSIWQWILLFLGFLGGGFAKSLAIMLMRVAKKIASLSGTEWDDRIIETIDKPVGIVCMSAFWFFVVRLIRIDGLLLDSLTLFIQLIFSIGVIWIFYRIADLISENVGIYLTRAEFAVDRELFVMIRKCFRISVVLIGILIATQNLGINILSLVAGLGLGGLAFALAAKDTAANLFGSLMIFSDRPFQVGDWVQFNEVEGTVESVGFRSTRVRTFYNSLISIPNGVVANCSIDNLGRRQYRRVRMILGVTYDTPPEKMEAFLEGIKNVIKANEFTRKDYFHVVFHHFGTSSLEILVYFFLRVENWAEELVEKQNVLIEILRLSKRLEVDFAFPTQTLHIESFPEKSPLQRHTSKWDDVSLRDMAKSVGPQGRDAKPSGLGIYVPPFKEYEK